MKTYLFVAVIYFLCITESSSSPPIVDAPWGRIAGIDTRSPSGVPYFAYLGIPFAQPPVGMLRFAKPLPHPGPGVGRVYNASSLGYICPQLGMEVLPSFPAMNEDCLTLNVYVPSGSRNGPRSVMVWIHGGSYLMGSSAVHTPSRLVTEGDVIVVVIQYRLGVLGFLSSGDQASAGNYGLFDQALALEWVKVNIQAFGGNPDTITVFGVSAGAGGVGFQLLSPYTKGFFKRSVMQSGTPLSPWAINKDPAKAFYSLAQRTGCSNPFTSWIDSLGSTLAQRLSGTFGEAVRMREHQRVVDCLRRLPAMTFVGFSYMQSDDGQPGSSDNAQPWTPVVDGDFVPRLPRELLNDVNYLVSNDVVSKDVMIGVTNNEGGLFLDIMSRLSGANSGQAGESAGEWGGQRAGESAGESFGERAGEDDGKANDGFTAFVASSALDETAAKALLRSQISIRYPELSEDESRLNTLVDALNFFYHRPLPVNGKASLQAIADSYADAVFISGAVGTSRHLARAADHSPQMTTGHRYLYLFNHFPASKAGQPLQGVSHGEDTHYEFDASPLLPKAQFNDEDRQVEDNFIAMLTDFAKNGPRPPYVRQD